jgi:hypothetical protein
VQSQRRNELSLDLMETLLTCDSLVCACITIDGHVRREGLGLYCAAGKTVSILNSENQEPLTEKV